MRKLFILFAAVLLCSGCIKGSLNPFYTKDSVVKLPKLNGMWYGVDANAEGKEVRVPMQIKGNRIYSMDKGRAKNEGALIFFKVDGQLFADMAMDNGKDKPSHLLFKLVDEPKRLVFIPLNYTWLAEQAKAGAVKISFVEEKDKGGILFTAAPKEWQVFISLYKDDAQAFAAADQFVMIQK